MDVAGIVVLRLTKDLMDFGVDDLALQAFKESGFPEIDAYFPPVVSSFMFAFIGLTTSPGALCEEPRIITFFLIDPARAARQTPVQAEARHPRKTSNRVSASSTPALTRLRKDASTKNPLPHLPFRAPGPGRCLWTHKNLASLFGYLPYENKLKGDGEIRGPTLAVENENSG
jgi:hypothetical protein